MAIEWFDAWLIEHLKLHPFARLPKCDEDSKPYYAQWERGFQRERIFIRAVADTASRRLFDEPPAKASEHFATLLRFAVEALNADRAEGPEPRPQHDLSTREGAHAASLSCERCGGEGLTSVFHPRPDPANRVPVAVAAYCVCAMGRWIDRTHRTKSPEIRKRMVDLEDVIAGRVGWLANPPAVRQEVF